MEEIDGTDEKRINDSRVRIYFCFKKSQKMTAIWSKTGLFKKQKKKTTAAQVA